MRIFSASMATETNTFAPCPTSLNSFKSRNYFPAGKHPDEPTHFGGPLWAVRMRAKDKDWQVFEGLVAAAQPSGITTRRTYEGIRKQILTDLQVCMPVDIVVLGLHGAMVADGYDDCEGDLLRSIRELVGPQTIIGATLDPHNHMTDAMVTAADCLVVWKEYPHTDVHDRANELLDICLDAHAGRCNPVAALVDCEMIVTVHTTNEPGLSIVKRLKSFEGHDGYGDVPDMGTKVLVYADDDPDKAQQLARQLADEMIAQREALDIDFVEYDAALSIALDETEGPTVIADGADNAGGGAASDSTFILRRMLERKITNAAHGPIWDPVAVQIAFDAGVGATLDLRVGGKIGPMSGDPIDLHCTVKGLIPAMRMTGMAEGTFAECGDSALIHANGIDIVLFSIRMQAMGTDMFTQLGCDLANKHIIVVKSSQHFYAHFSRIAKRVIYAGAPGTVARDLNTLKYHKIKLPKWPLTQAG